MAQDEDASTAAAVLQRLLPHEQRWAVIHDLTAQIATASDPTHLPQARLLANLIDEEFYESAALWNSTESLVKFIFRLVPELSQGSQSLAALVSLCQTARCLHETVYGELNKVILCFWQLRFLAKTDSPGRPFSEFLALDPKPDIKTAAGQCLDVLTMWYRMDSRTALSEDTDSFVRLINDLPVTEKTLARKALAAAIASIDASKDRSSGDPGHDVAHWRGIVSLTLRAERPDIVSSGLALWLRKISHSVPQNLLEEDRYWAALESVLGTGTSEQQKVALAIFRASVAAFYRDKADPSTRQLTPTLSKRLESYEKFMAVYQAVALDRYVNQVEESLPDLQQISRKNSGLGLRWIYTLLTTALSPKAQYSVRRIIGGWLIKNEFIFISDGRSPDDYTMPSSDNSYRLRLLEESMLSWIATGTFFVSTVRYDADSNPYCWHGDHVVGFLRAIISGNKNSLAHDYIKICLCFLDAQAAKLFSHARAYIIDGLARGIEDAQITLYESEKTLLEQVVSISGFQEISSDFVDITCAVLLNRRLDHGRDDSAGLSHGSETTRAFKTLSSGIIEMIPEGTEQMLSWLSARIEQTQQKCLSGHGLIASIQLVSDALNATERVNLPHIGLILAAISEEMQIQDFPRIAVMRLIHILLHPLVVARLARDPNASATVSSSLDALNTIAPSRIYVFTTLASAWHSLLLTSQADNDAIIPVLFSFIKSSALHPPASPADLELEAIFAAKLETLDPRKTYESYYGHKRSFGYACVLDMLNTLPRREPYNTAARHLLEELLAPWAAQKPPIPVFSSWKSTAQLQVVMLLLEHVLATGRNDAASDTVTTAVDPADHPTAEALLNTLLQILEVEMLPRNRFLLEWATSRILHSTPSLRPRILHLLTGPSATSDPRVCISALKLALATVSMPSARELDGHDLAVRLALLSTSAKVAVRHEAQWMVPQLFAMCASRGWSSVTAPGGIFALLDAQIRGLDAYANPPSARLQESLDPERDHNLSNLVEGFYLDIDPVERPGARRKDFLDVRARHGECARPGLLELGEVRAMRAQHQQQHQQQQPPKEEPQHTSTPATNIPLQTKGKISLADPARIPSSLLEASAPGGLRTRARPSPLIVIASLIDSPFNLGGLARVTEILGAASLQVHSARVLERHEFTSVAVSAHAHIPIDVLPRGDIAGFLRARKVEGYEVVGVEQTDSSRVLGDRGRDGARFKEGGRTVLLLGSESEGIPGELLADCDWCVEVRQRGVTRSMNVQTAAAVVVHEYMLQFQEQGQSSY